MYFHVSQKICVKSHLSAFKRHVTPWWYGQRSLTFEETLAVDHGCWDSARRALCGRLRTPVTAGNRRRTLVRKKVFNMLKSSHWHQRSLAFNFKRWSTFKNVCGTFRLCSTSTARSDIVSQPLLWRYLVVTNRLLCSERLIADLSTTAELFLLHTVCDKSEKNVPFGVHLASFECFPNFHAYGYVKRCFVSKVHLIWGYCREHLPWKIIDVHTKLFRRYSSTMGDYQYFLKLQNTLTRTSWCDGSFILLPSLF